MRWSIQVQLVCAVLSVVVLTLVLASGTTAYWTAARVRRQQEEDLRRVARVLAEAQFPLTVSVLAQVRALSGAELVIVDQQGRIQATTLELGGNDAGRFLERAGEHERAGGPHAASSDRVMMLAGQAYLVDRMQLEGHRGKPVSGSLFVLYRADHWSARIQQATYPALIAGLFAGCVAMVVTVLLARRFVRPIRELVRRTGIIAAGDFTPAAVSRRNDELRDLEDSINSMVERLSRFEGEIRRAEQMQTLGRMGAGMAHQLRNAATGGRMAVELHQRECPLRGTDESLEVALRQFRVMESFLQRFLALGKLTDGPRTPGSANQLVKDVLDLFHPMARHLGVQLEFVPSEEHVRIHGHQEALRELLGNLIVNACQAAVEASSLPPRVVIRLTRPQDGWGRIAVRDTGAGPPAALQPRLFEPFVTDKPDGMGLGLFVAREIAQAHGGTLLWERDAGMTCFYFEFPLGDPYGQRADRG